jgi:arylformamidase
MDLEGVQYIDISPEISSSLSVYPGDKKFQRDVSYDMMKGDHMTLSSIETTLHIGAHTDGPCHYQKGGEGIGQRSLDYYMGPCQVIDLSNVVVKGSKVVSEDFKGFQIETSRILIKTDSHNHNAWDPNFVSLSKSLIKYLIKSGVKLIGIDTPSIDAADSKDLECHTLIAENNMAILEGIDLAYVDQGKYQLIALPLKIKNGDASPVRAVLLPYT